MKADTEAGKMVWAEEADAPLLVLFKDGSTKEMQGIDGGGMTVGADADSPESGYEVHGYDADGEFEVLMQADIAAVLNLDTMEQVEFGNPFLASRTGHPRGHAKA